MYGSWKNNKITKLHFAITASNPAYLPSEDHTFHVTGESAGTWPAEAETRFGTQEEGQEPGAQWPWWQRASP